MTARRRQVRLTPPAPKGHVVATRSAHLSFLDHRRRAFCEFGKHERHHYAPGGIADGPWHQPRRRRSCALRSWAASSLVGRLGVGWVLDRFFGARVACAVYLLTAAGMLLLARADSLVMGCVAAGLIGVGAGGEADFTPYLLTRYFGVHAFSTLYGITWTFYAIAGAMGPIILGRAFDSTGSYTSSLSLLAITVALAGALMLLLPRYARAE